MTNHPHRQRDDDEQSAEEMAAEAAALLPAELREKLGIPEPGGIPPQGSAEVPSHNGNGVPPGLRPNAAKLIGQAVAETLGQVLPQALFQAFAAVLSQVPVQTVTQQHMCATCLAARITWENIHHADMEQAMNAAAQAAGITPGDPQAARLDLAAFLPPHLRPGERAGMPNVGQAATTVGGMEVCPMHIPGVQAGRSQLVVATAAMSPAMLGQLAGAR